MKSNYLYYSLLLAVFLVLWWIIGDTISQPGIGDLEGSYVEMAMFRNENNTGPVVRIFAVHAADTLWEEMRAYGDFMPHTKYGNTKVFFFLEDLKESIHVFPNQPYVSSELAYLCVAKYEKTAMGEVNFVKYPYRDN
jgi:hypothetical protein